MARIVLNTFGSLGDLHPYLALALGLQRRGHQPVIATSAIYRAKVEALGLAFAAVRPDVGELMERPSRGETLGPEDGYRVSDARLPDAPCRRRV